MAVYKYPIINNVLLPQQFSSSPHIQHYNSQTYTVRPMKEKKSELLFITGFTGFIENGRENKKKLI